jgi:hypothetical protein
MRESLGAVAQRGSQWFNSRFDLHPNRIRNAVTEPYPLARLDDASSRSKAQDRELVPTVKVDDLPVSFGLARRGACFRFTLKLITRIHDPACITSRQDQCDWQNSAEGLGAVAHVVYNTRKDGLRPIVAVSDHLLGVRQKRLTT